MIKSIKFLITHTNTQTHPHRLTNTQQRCSSNRNCYYFSYMVKVLPLLGPFSVCESVIDDLFLTRAAVHPCERKEHRGIRARKGRLHSLFFVLRFPYSRALVCFRAITQPRHDTHHLSQPRAHVLHHFHASLLPRTFIPHHPLQHCLWAQALSGWN